MSYHILLSPILSYPILSYPILSDITSHHITHHITSHHIIASHHITSHHIIIYDMIYENIYNSSCYLDAANMIQYPGMWNIESCPIKAVANAIFAFLVQLKGGRTIWMYTLQWCWLRQTHTAWWKITFTSKTSFRFRITFSLRHASAVIGANYYNVHRNGKVIMVTALVVTADVEDCLQRRQWRAGQSPWRPSRFNTGTHWKYTSYQRVG